MVGTPSPAKKPSTLRTSEEGSEGDDEREKEPLKQESTTTVKLARKDTTPTDPEKGASGVPPLVKSASVPASSHPVPPVEAPGSPLAPTGGAVQPSTSEASNEPPLRVLVVDDDSLTRTLMTRMLTRLGCVVETASDGQEALDVLLGGASPDNPLGRQPQFFDLISLDNAMPVMTGQAAVKRLRALGRQDFVVGLVTYPPEVF